MKDVLSQNILINSLIGFEFEFVSKMSYEQIAKSLKKELKKNIEIPKEQIGLDSWTHIHHSKLEVTKDTFKLEPDYSISSMKRGGCELVTGPVPYSEARLILIKILNWIKEYGATTDRCGLHINISFDTDKTKDVLPINNLNVLKYILSFNENRVYELFPNRKNNVYARSIKHIYPINRFTFVDEIRHISTDRYVVPMTKYFGVNFSKLTKGYLEFRYIGGERYHLRIDNILNLLDMFVLSIYNTLKYNSVFSELDLFKINELVGGYKKAALSFISLDNFLLEYKDIQLLVDLHGEKQRLQTYYPIIRDMLFNLIIENGFRKGILNLDTDTSKFQLRYANISNANKLENMELFDCKIYGIVNRCDIYSSDIRKSNLTDCRIFQDNIIIDSKIQDSPIYISNTLKNCYINNGINIINSEIDGGIIRSGEIGLLSILKNDVEIIDTASVLSAKEHSKDSSIYNNGELIVYHEK